MRFNQRPVRRLAEWLRDERGKGGIDCASMIPVPREPNAKPLKCVEAQVA
jgi:hypothetical protein